MVSLPVFGYVLVICQTINYYTHEQLTSLTVFAQYLRQLKTNLHVNCQ